MSIRYLALFASLSFSTCTGIAAADDHDSGVRHYLSLGTSLSVGIQPDGNGVNQLTDDGYADQLYDIVAPEFRKLKLTKLGCPGETTVTMITGGKCNYEEGSQLAQAVEFLHAHKNKVAIVTIDMGVNDVLAANCIDAATAAVDSACLLNAFATLSNNLASIVTTLRQVAHPDTKFVAMNYYNTFLAFWFAGSPGQALAYDSALLANILNYDVLGSTYGAFGIPVADVAAAFDSGNFSPNVATGLPQNVLNICFYTWMCASAPVGPNIHANRYGYGVIAATIAATLDR
jgi:lysophospholipase L1-like esterase